MERLYTRPFALCALASFAQAVSFGFFLHFPGFLKELGARESEIGVLMALTALSAVALGPFFGRLMDRHGRRPVIVGGNLLNVGVVGLYVTFQALSPALYVVRILHGVAETMLYGALFTYAADIVPASRTAQGLAVFGVAAMLSITVGGVIGDATLPCCGAFSWDNRPLLTLGLRAGGGGSMIAVHMAVGGEASRGSPRAATRGWAGSVRQGFDAGCRGG
jgi:MFS family permease